MPPKSLRGLTQIDDYIKNRSSSAADKFGLGERWRLVMHSSEGSLPLVERDIALHDVRIQAVRQEFLATIGSREETTLVFFFSRFNHESTGQTGLSKNHVGTRIRVTASIGSRLEYARHL